jgi:hypothetical protein
VKHLVCLLFVALVLHAGCAKTSPGEEPPAKNKNICPDNPILCSGSCCGIECVDTKLDARNCGACNVICETGTVCANGKCGCLPTGAACGMGQSCCGNAGCKSLMSDINNCGACGKACGVGSTCENGACKCGGTTCAAGQVCCEGTCAATCAGNPDMSMGMCSCPQGCPLTNVCVGPNCCFEDYLILGTCMPDPNCLQGP